MNRRGIRGIGAALATLVVFLSFSVTAEAAQPKYVALGDSYASGNGAGSYLTGTANAGCYRSLKSYPGLIATASGLQLVLEACSGATINDVTTKQMGNLGGAAYVTITIGGNDIGFSSVVSTCLGTNTTACLNAVATATSKAGSTAFRAQLATLFSAVKAEAPGAKVVATSYPRLFNGKDCSILTSFTSTEMTQLNKGADVLATAISNAAGDAGVTFADVRTPFVGHAVCDRSPWILNASLFKSYESFHPNATGHSSGYRPVVATALGPIASTGTTAKVTTSGIGSSDTTRGHVKVPKS
ncbi:SGNH/GDSL hydrolase family protein [Tessaracoccus sp. G1721]